MKVIIFFFQAEDGIRDYKVTGVQTCALPISRAHREAVAPVSRQPVWQRFAELAATWKEERGFSSSLTDMLLSPSYQKVIALGRPVVPYILAELAARPDHWFWALATITGVNPIPERAAGNLRAMTQAWLRWGDKEGLFD